MRSASDHRFTGAKSWLSSWPTLMNQLSSIVLLFIKDRCGLKQSLGRYMPQLCSCSLSPTGFRWVCDRIQHRLFRLLKQCMKCSLDPSSEACDGDAVQREWKFSQEWKTAASRGWQAGNLSLHRPPTAPSKRGGGREKNESTVAGDGNLNRFPILLSGSLLLWDLSLPLSTLVPDRYYCSCC